jgi:hypothetical protein
MRRRFATNELPQLLEITEVSTKVSRGDIAVCLPGQLEPPGVDENGASVPVGSSRGRSDRRHARHPTAHTLR